MSDLILYGYGFATYVRSARMALEEKGVAYEMAKIELGSPEHAKLHPFGKMPILTHGDFVLYEAFPIARYVDEAFEGPALQPQDVQERALMGQWISSVGDYIYPAMIGKLARQRLINPLLGKETDQSVIDEAIPEIERQLALIEETLGRTAFLAGNDYSLADMFMESILAAVGNTPEGESLLPEFSAITDWRTKLAARPAVKKTRARPPSRD